MDASRTDFGRYRAINGAWRLVRFVAVAPTGGLDLPRASVASWVLAHFLAVTMFGVPVVAAGVATSRLWASAVLLIWLGVASGLCLRLLGLLVGRAANETLRLPTRRRLPFELKFGCFVFLSTAAFVATQDLGWFVAVGFLATVAITSGLRLAGLEASAGVVRPPLYYVSAVFSVGGLLVIASLALVVVVLYIVTGALVVPQYRRMEATLEEWLGVDVRREVQLQMLLGWIALTPAVAVVCEAVSAVSRYESGLRRRLVAHERREERDQLAQALHDGEILSGLEDLRRRVDDEDQRRLISSLELRLRGLQVERGAERGARTLRACLRHPLRSANLLEVEVAIDAGPETLGLELTGADASLVERLAMLQINNSSGVEAESAELALAVHLNDLVVTYIDDGGGFDPIEIDEAGGGMSRLRYDIEQVGGSLEFERRARGTLSTARLPRS